jgi:hypothetical protein
MFEFVHEIHQESHRFAKTEFTHCLRRVQDDFSSAFKRRSADITHRITFDVAADKNTNEITRKKAQRFYESTLQ